MNMTMFNKICQKDDSTRLFMSMFTFHPEETDIDKDNGEPYTLTHGYFQIPCLSDLIKVAILALECHLEVHNTSYHNTQYGRNEFFSFHMPQMNKSKPNLTYSTVSLVGAFLELCGVKSSKWYNTPVRNYHDPFPIFLDSTYPPQLSYQSMILAHLEWLNFEPLLSTYVDFHTFEQRSTYQVSIFDLYAMGISSIHLEHVEKHLQLNQKITDLIGKGASVAGLTHIEFELTSLIHKLRLRNL